MKYVDKLLKGKLLNWMIEMIPGLGIQLFIPGSDLLLLAH
jgi:hypothetical protein